MLLTPLNHSSKIWTKNRKITICKSRQIPTKPESAKSRVRAKNAAECPEWKEAVFFCAFAH
jgi:hypothetical protein